MNILGYFFQTGHFKGFSKKWAHRQKFFLEGADDPPAPLPILPAPKGLFTHIETTSPLWFPQESNLSVK